MSRHARARVRRANAELMLARVQGALETLTPQAQLPNAQWPSVGGVEFHKALRHLGSCEEQLLAEIRACVAILDSPEPTAAELLAANPLKVKAA